MMAQAGIGPRLGRRKRRRAPRRARRADATQAERARAGARGPQRRRARPGSALRGDPATARRRGRSRSDRRRLTWSRDRRACAGCVAIGAPRVAVVSRLRRRGPLAALPAGSRSAVLRRRGARRPPARRAIVVALFAAVALGSVAIRRLPGRRDRRARLPGRDGGRAGPRPSTGQTAGRRTLWMLAIDRRRCASVLRSLAADRGRRWRLAGCSSPLGAAGVVIALVVDAPQGLDTGQAGSRTRAPSAVLLDGFWRRDRRRRRPRALRACLLAGIRSRSRRAERLTATRRPPAPALALRRAGREARAARAPARQGGSG